MSIAAAYDAYGHAICAGDLWGNDPLAGGCFGSVERLALRDLPDRHWERLKRWLYRCGVPFRQRVLVLPVVTTDSTPAVVPPWERVVTHAEAFFSSDNTVVTNAAAGDGG